MPRAEVPWTVRTLTTLGTTRASSESPTAYHYSLPHLPYSVCNLLLYSTNLLALQTQMQSYTDSCRYSARKKYKVKPLSLELGLERFLP